jgi:hypothetical protein
MSKRLNYAQRANRRKRRGLRPESAMLVPQLLNNEGNAKLFRQISGKNGFSFFRG